MLHQDIIKANYIAEKVYQIINNKMSEGLPSLVDIAFPEHDGVPNDYVIADMMELRQTLNSLSTACQIWVKQLSEVIDMKEKEEKVTRE